MARTLGNELNLGRQPNGAPFGLSPDDRSRHLYVAGATRAGKSKFLENCIRQDIKQWQRHKCPVVFLDRHGSSYDDLVAWLAWNAIHLPKDLPVILFDPREDVVLGYNVLRKRGADAGVVVDSFVQALTHVFGQLHTTATPLFAEVAGNILWVLYELQLTLAEAIYLTDAERKSLQAAMLARITNSEVLRYWKSYHRLPALKFDETIGSTVRRLRAFVLHERFKWMFGQQQDSLDWRLVLDQGAIVLVNLSGEAGRLTEEHASALGSTMLHDLWLAASERGKKKDVPPAYIYLDEFQEFVSPTLAKSLAQSSGFGLHLIMSHQFPTQLKNAGPHGKAVYDEVLGNAQNKIIFHMEHPEDLALLATMLFLGVFDTNKIKLAIHSIKVLDYREVKREQFTRGESETEGESDQWRDATSDTTYPSGEVGTASGRDSGGGRSRSQTKTHSVTESTVLEPVMGKELSNVHFESLSEQLHHAMVALKDQKQREFVAKRHDLRIPMTLRTPNVSDMPCGPKRIATYVKQMRERWPFILAVAEAQQRIEKRQQDLERRFGQIARDEAATAKRRIR
jgi:hypothetical protein